MFSSLQPPMLIQPINMRYSSLFPPHEGYTVHFIDENQAFAGYKDGWTFPLSGQQQRFVSAPPMLLIKESGCITSAGSTFSKGYAHQFCQENGTEPIYLSLQALFPDRPEDKWMLVPNSVTMVWLQYRNKNQYCGDSGYEMERIYYGRILIRRLDIVELFPPRIGKDAANPNMGDKMYYINTVNLFKDDWSLVDRDTNEYLCEALANQKMERYQHAVTIALKRAGYIE